MSSSGARWCRWAAVSRPHVYLAVRSDFRVKFTVFTSRKGGHNALFVLVTSLPD